MNQPLPPIHARLAALFTQLETGLHERGLAIRLCLLAAIAGESVFFLGPPGVAKSLVARRLQQAFGSARCFDYLMGRFSTPEEIFGPVSIKRLKDEDLYVRRVEDYLPAADIAFLDEIWKAGPPIQNALLTALNEKVYRNGPEEIHLPLKLLIAASNETAPDESAQAFWDRFLIRLELQPLQDAQAFRSMLADPRDPYQDCVGVDTKLDKAEWQAWQAAAAGVTLDDETLDILLELRSRLQTAAAEGKGPYVSDRRWKKLAGLLRASAACHDGIRARAMDCFVLEHCLWNRSEERTLVNGVLRESIARHAHAREVRLGAFQEDLAAIQAEFRQATRQQLQETRREPLIADGEYYRLSGKPDATELRIWKQDWDELPGGDQADRVCELFRYRQGQYEGTASHRCKRGADWSLVVDGVPVNLVCEEKTVSEDRYQAPDEAGWKLWDQRLAGFQRDCRGEAERIAGLLAGLADDLVRHFFVPADAGTWLGKGLRDYLVQLSELEAAATGCLDSHGDC